MANIDAANGDTEYVLNSAQAPFVLDLGNRADGAAVWIANIDPTAVITVEWSGSHAGTGRVNLAGQGDRITIPGGDVTRVTVTSNIYPAIIGWAYLDPGMRVETAFAETGILGGASGVTDLIAGATGAAQTVTATLAAAAGHTCYLTGFEVTGGGATAASIVPVTVTGLVGGTLTYYVAVPAGATAGIVPLVVQYQRPLAASATNQAIAVSASTFGVGNAAASVVAHGFRQ